MVNMVELSTRRRSGIRQTLNIGMPDARKPHLPNVGLEVQIQDIGWLRKGCNSLGRGTVVRCP